MAAKKQQIVKAVPPPESISVLKDATRDVLGKYAQILSLDAVSPKVLAETLQALRDVKKILEDKNSGLEVLAKKRVEAYIKGHGKIATDKGSMSAEVDGLKLFMKPWRTGYDAKKVEALLRAKGKSPDTRMVQNISYSMPDEGTATFEKLKKELGDELESCRYEETWVVSTPE